MNNKFIKKVLTLLAVMAITLSINTNVFARGLYAESDIIGDKKPDETIEIFREKGIEEIHQIKDLDINSYKTFDMAMVEGGNIDAINPLATKQHIAKADMVENVGEAGEEFEIFLEDENGEPIIKQTRQFITFTTKSGKTMHLIIDHEKTSQNVSLLTEVGEQDLLNMIEGEKSSINVKPIDKEVPKEELKDEEQEVVQKPKEKSKFSLPVIFIILGTVIGAGYYFKIYKPKLEDFDDEYDEDETEYEEEYDEEFEEVE